MDARRKRRVACLAAVLFAFLSLGTAAFSVRAEEAPSSGEGVPPEEPAYLFVTVADGDGRLALACAEVPLTDGDGDGVLTVSDALASARDTYFAGDDERGDYGFYLNHAAAELSTPVQEGDLLYVFPAGEPAIYCYFDAPQASVSGAQQLTLTLSAASFDEEGQPAALPVADAVICINGADTAFTTDEEGRVTLQFDGSGSCVVSARKEGVALTPPVCTVTVSGEEPYAGDRGVLLRWIALAAAATFGLVLAVRRRIRRGDVL